jgi:hypothetical protein
MKDFVSRFSEKLGRNKEPFRPFNEGEGKEIFVLQKEVGPCVLGF